MTRPDGFSYQTLEVTRTGHTALVVLNRPEAANALNTRMAEEFDDFFGGLYVDDAGIRCVVLTGAGQRAFCAGGDLKERNGMDDAMWQRQHAVFERAALALMDCPLPLIAAVNGAAYGGGLEILLACDFAYGVPGARFALTEVSLGIIPGMAGTQYLPAAVGIRRAKEIVMSAQPFGASEALQWGILNRVCDEADLLNEVMSVAERISTNAPIAVRQAKSALNHAGHESLRAGYRFEIEAYNRTVPTADRREGVVAFNEKRKPVFRGE